MPSDRTEHGGGRDRAFHDAQSIQSVAVAEDAPTDGQVLAYAATNDRYAPADVGLLGEYHIPMMDVGTVVSF